MDPWNSARASTGGLHLVANVVELPGKPFGRLHDGVVPVLKSVFDKGLHHGVGHLGGKLGIVAGEGDHDQAAESIPSDFETGR